MNRAINIAVLLSVFFFGCGQETMMAFAAQAEGSSQATDSAISGCNGNSGSCQNQHGTPPTAVEQTLLDFASSASFEMLDTDCGLASDSARQIVRRAPYSTMEQLASVAEVGTGALRMLNICGRQRAGVDPDLAIIFDQPSSDKLDHVVTFTYDQMWQTRDLANDATRSQLESIDGIGPVTAGNLIAARPMRSIFQLRYVSGIGVVRLTAMRDAAASFNGPNDPWAAAPSDSGSYLLTEEALQTIVNSFVNDYMAQYGETLWYDNGYWAYGGDAFTDDFSRNYFLRVVEGYFRDDAMYGLDGWPGTSFADEAAANSAVHEFLWELEAASVDRWIEYYAESIGEYTA